MSSKSTFLIYDPSTREKIAQFTAPNHHSAAVKMAGRGKKLFWVRKTGDSKVKVYKGTLEKGPNKTVMRFAPGTSKAQKSKLTKQYTEKELVEKKLATKVTFKGNVARAYYEESFQAGEDVKLINEMTERSIQGRKKVN